MATTLPVIAVAHNGNDTDITALDTVKITLEGGKVITYGVTGDCCSCSWIELINGRGFDYLIGKCIMNIKCLDQAYTTEGAVYNGATIELVDGDLPPSSVQECDEIELWCITVKDPNAGDPNTGDPNAGEEVEPLYFFHRNSSNGYYRGYITLNGLKDTIIQDITLNRKGQLIVVTGAPGSGKTHFCTTLLADDPKTVIYDDCDVPLEEARQHLIAGTRVVLCGVRYLNYYTNEAWSSYYEYIIGSLGISNRERIITYVFKYEKLKCIANVCKREQDTDIRKRLIKDIDHLETRYRYGSLSFHNKIMLDVY